MFVSATTTVYMFRTGEKTTSRPEIHRDVKEMITEEKAPLNSNGKLQAKEFRKWIEVHSVAFDVVISSEAVAAKETAQIALKGRKIDVEDNIWREVDIGSFEGKPPISIKQDYAEYHPGKKVPADANECFNYPWPEIEGKEKKKFEPLKTEFKARIQSAFADLVRTYQGKTVAVFTHCEPIRETVMISKGTENFFSTPFGQNISKLLPSPATDHTIDTAISLPMFKPDHASAIKLLITDEDIYIDDTHKLIFRG